MKYVIERSNEALFSHSGLALVGSLLKESGLVPLIDQIDPKRSTVDVYPSSDVAKSMVGLLCMAKTDFDDIIPFRKDRFFVRALDLSRKKAPSSPTLRQRLNIAEIELRVLIGQCLNRRIPDKTSLEQEVEKWQSKRNQAKSTVDWRFTNENARIKLKRLYPIILT